MNPYTYNYHPGSTFTQSYGYPSHPTSFSPIQSQQMQAEQYAGFYNNAWGYPASSSSTPSSTSTQTQANMLSAYPAPAPSPFSMPVPASHLGKRSAEDELDTQPLSKRMSRLSLERKRRGSDERRRIIISPPQKKVEIIPKTTEVDMEDETTPAPPSKQSRKPAPDGERMSVDHTIFVDSLSDSESEAPSSPISDPENTLHLAPTLRAHIKRIPRSLIEPLRPPVDDPKEREKGMELVLYRAPGEEDEMRRVLEDIKERWRREKALSSPEVVELGDEVDGGGRILGEIEEEDEDEDEMELD